MSNPLSYFRFALTLTMLSFLLSPLAHASAGAHNSAPATSNQAQATLTFTIIIPPYVHVLPNGHIRSNIRTCRWTQDQQGTVSCP